MNESTKSLNVIIKLALHNRKLVTERNYDVLKHMLYNWCVCTSGWSNLHVKAELFTVLQTKLSYTDFLFVEELSFQIARFLDFGCQYWNGGVNIDAPRISKSAITALILENLK